MKVKYLYRSWQGECYVNCKIIEKLDENHYRIHFENPVYNTVEEDIVEKKNLGFFNSSDIKS